MPHRKRKKTQENAPAAPESSSDLHSTEHLEMRIPARAEWVRVVRLATAGVASRAGFAYDDIEDIKLAVAEACNNAILHSAGLHAGTSDSLADDEGLSGASGSTPLVTIRWRLVENGIRVSVSDEGRLAPPGLARRAGSTPLETTGSPLDELPEGGMGLLLIESLMDEVEHESGLDSDTTIHMTKRVGAKRVAALQNSGAARPDPDAPVAIGARSVESASAQHASAPRSQR